MKNVYAIVGQSTSCNGNIINWIGAVYVNKQKALDVCDEMNQTMQRYDPNYMAYVSGPILLDDSKDLA